MRRAAKVDGNHGAIVEALRKLGIWVRSTAALGDGFPDLLVWFRQFHLIELKDGAKPPSARKLTPAEELFFASCPGPKHLCNNLDEVLNAIGFTK
jgi:hypothetical protein